MPPGNYFAPLVPLMDAILAVRPGDDVGGLRRAIRAAFDDEGDSIAGNQVNAILPDLTDPSATDADRRSAADELAHYARADPAEIAQLRAALAGGVLAGASAATARAKDRGAARGLRLGMHRGRHAEKQGRMSIAWLPRTIEEAGGIVPASVRASVRPSPKGVLGRFGRG